MVAAGILRYCVLMKMYNSDILVGIIVSEVLSNQASVALLRSIFRAEETAVVKLFNLVPFLYMPFFQKAREDTDISIP